MEKSSKILLKYILDIDLDFCKIEEVFGKRHFFSAIKGDINFSIDPVRLILRAFDVNDDAKGEKIFNLFDDFYKRKITSQEIIDKIENILRV